MKWNKMLCIKKLWIGTKWIKLNKFISNIIKVIGLKWNKMKEIKRNESKKQHLHQITLYRATESLGSCNTMWNQY